MPVAKVEGPWSFYKPADRITADLLRAIAMSYDPAKRRAKVVCGYDPATGAAGKAHVAGMYLPSPGVIEAAQFDEADQVLRVKISQNQNHAGKPAVRELVKMGFDGVSIKWMPKSDLPGAPPYLEHVALLSGEVPGTPGIPPLSQVFRALEEWGLAEGLPIMPAAVPQVGADGFQISTFSRSLAECERSWQKGDAPDDGQPAKEDSTMALTPEETSALITRAVTEAVAAIRPEITAAVEAGVAPIRTIAETATTAAAAAAETARTLAENTSIATHEGRIRSCTLDGRLRPGDLDGELETLRALPAGEAREKFVVRVEGRKPMRSLMFGLPQVEAGDEGMPPELSSFATPDGKVRVAPEQAEEYARVRNSEEYKANPTPETFARVALALSRGGAN